jgi:hypothetical protein
MVLCFLGYTPSVALSEVVAVYIILLGTGLATQTAKEGMIHSQSGQRVNQRYMESIVALRYTKFTLTNGSVLKGPDVLTQITRACVDRAEADAVLLVVTAASGLAHRNAESIPPEHRRRSSSISDDLRESVAVFQHDNVEEQAHETMNNKFNAFSLDGRPVKMMMWVIALAAAAIPTVVGKLRNETTMIDEEATAVEIASDIGSIVVLIVGSGLLSFGALRVALTELSVCDNWARFLSGSICAGTGWRNRQNEALDFHFRLDTREAVESFEVLYTCVRTVCHAYGQFHLAAFEILMILSNGAIIMVFASSIMDVEVDSWLVLLFTMGGGVLLTMAAVFMKLVRLHDRLGASMVKLLRHQRRLNEELIEDEKDAAKAEALAVASRYISRMCESIADVHEPLKVIGVISLTKENVVKGTVAMIAALVTTLLRQSINL